MPLDALMKDGTTFDPDYPRTSYDGPPLLPPGNDDGGGDPFGRRNEKNEKGGNLYAEYAAVAGYACFAILASRTEFIEIAIPCLVQTFFAGATYSLLDVEGFSDSALGRFTNARGPQFLKDWNNHSVLKKTFIASAFALFVSIPTALGIANCNCGPDNDLSFREVAQDLIKLVPCKIAEQSMNSGFRNMYCLDDYTPR